MERTNEKPERFPESREGFQTQIRKQVLDYCERKFGIRPQLAQPGRYLNGFKITITYPPEFKFPERSSQGHFIGDLKREILRILESNECFGEIWTWTGGDLKKKENLVLTSESGKTIEIGVDSYENYEGMQSHLGRTLSVMVKIPFWKQLNKS